VSLEVETRRTTCNRDCPDACSILVDVEPATGRALRLRGDPDHPVTQGFLCRRTSRFLERQYSKERITKPLLRGPAGFREATWDEALDRVAADLTRIKRESGPAAIFHYRSGGSLGLLKPLSDYLFERYGPVTIHRGDICGGAGDAAQAADFGDCDANDLFDLENARTIVLWGKNVFTSSPHLIPILRAARARGVRVLGIDPVRTRSADICERHLQPRPGCDAAIALGIARHLFDAGGIHAEAAQFCEGFPAFEALARSRSVAAWAERADVPVGELEAVARAYASGPSAILVGWGMGRRTNGASIVRAVDALAAVSGNMGRKGGGALFYWKRRKAFDLSFVKGAAVAPRTISEPLFGPDVLAAKDPPVRAIWITCGNPVAMLPESGTVARALETRELVVVVDSFLTDTAERAHVFLPTTTLLEDDDLLGAYGHHYLGVARPVVARPEGCKTDLEILQGLASRLGLAGEMAGTAREWKKRLLAPLTRESGVTLEQLEAGPVRSPRAKDVLYEGNRFATPSGKARLSVAEPALGAGDPSYPLQLLSVSTDRFQASQAHSSEQTGPTEATVHPDAAGGRPDGAHAFLVSCVARIPVVVRHDAQQRRDVVLVAKGGWFGRGRAANALVRARTTDLGEGAAYYDEGVRLEG
jgi:anaerobic selenocysteine-containing dehydrogenase